MRYFIFILGIWMLSACNPSVYSLSGEHTRVVFNQPVDKRYAWLGNDAEVVNFQDEILNLINNATTSIEVSTMTFSKIEIADALIAKANAGVKVRIIGNGGHRLKQDGWKKALQGRLEILDNNLPALVHRINFQADAGPAPAGWVADKGDVYGDRGEGVTYGWLSNQAAYMRSAGVYQLPILDDCYSRANADGTQTWEIAVPNGPYYIALMTGRPDADTRTYIKAENEQILNSGAFSFASRTAGSFWGEPVDGGTETNPGEDPTANSVRVSVNDGKLTLSIGNSTAPAGTVSGLCFLEIYRGDPLLQGDNTYDDGVDNTIQDRQTMHSKFIIVDAGTSNQHLWVTSGNLTQGMDAASNNSEDAIISTDNGLISTFYNMFNQMWGSNLMTPIISNANFGTYKTGTSTNLTVDDFPWKIRFSPSIGTTDLATAVKDHISGSTKEMILIMEQFSNNSGARGFSGTNSIVSTITPKLGPNYRLRGIIGSDAGVSNGTFPGSYDEIAIPTVGGTEMKIHNKYALVDALRDTRTTLRGKILCGSMNWTQSALHFNDEQTLIIQNPYIANQYLQHAMSRLRERSIVPSAKTDIVLVLDRSASMNDVSLTPGISKLEASKEAANLFLDIIEADNTHRLSMVRFGNAIEAFSPAITLTDYNPTKRTEYHTGVNSTYATMPIGGATCYNKALEESLTQLNVAVPNERKIVHFFTDGKENCTPNSSTFYTALQTKNIEVHSTGFGADTDMSTSLEGLANATGGTYAQIDLNPLNLKKRFAEVARDAMSLSTVLDPTYQLKSRESVKTSFFLDQKTTTVKVIASWGNQIKLAYKDFYLIAPNGKKIDMSMNGVEWNNGIGYVVISLNKKLDYDFLGTWTIVFTRSEERPEDVLPLDLIVFADGDLFFKAECFPSLTDKSKYVLLSRLLNQNEAVKNLVVTAEIKYPFNEEYGVPRVRTIKLSDDGKHQDTKAIDGVFGAVLDSVKPGNYQIHFIAEGTISVKDKKESIRRESTVSFQVKR